MSSRGCFSALLPLLLLSISFIVGLLIGFTREDPRART
jgi:hypothetical protein